MSKEEPGARKVFGAVEGMISLGTDPKLLIEHDILQRAWALIGKMQLGGNNAHHEVTEIFCGHGNLSKAFIKLGYRVRSVDKKIDDQMDLTEDDGYVLCVAALAGT